MKRLCLITLLSMLSFGVWASDLLEVLPVTDKIIQLKFDDGYALMPRYHHADDVTEAFIWPLNVEDAARLQSYIITSADDANYSTGKQPVNVGRKSKIHELSNICKWDFDLEKCMNDYVQMHYIYLELPTAMEDGKTYTINVSALADNVDEWTFTYDVETSRSVAIHTNQVGYPSASQKKYAYVSQWMGDMGPLEIDDKSGVRFDVYSLNADGSLGSSVYNGTLQKQKDFQTGENDCSSRDDLSPHYNFAFSDIWECDFSSVTTEGEYVLVIEGIGCSYPFRIGPDAAFEAFYHATRALYYERSIIELPEEYAGKWARPEWTNRKFVYTNVRTMDLTDESGNNQKQNIYNNFDWTVDLSNMHGYYHDAGDWDGYFSHFRVPRTLMYAYEMAPQKFQDGELNIPEEQTGTHLPDILDEAVWLVDYFKGNVGPTGGIFGSRVHPDISKTGGLDNEQTYRDAGFVFKDDIEVEGMPSYEDHTTYIVHGEDPRDSYAFASIAAQYAYCLELAEDQTSEDYSTLITDYLDAAEAAYTWADNNTQGNDENVKHFIENRAAAAAWLYKMTGEASYLTQLKADLTAKNITSTSSDLGESQWAVWAYVTIDGTDSRYSGTFDQTLQDDLFNAIKKDAKNKVTNSIDNNRSMRMGGNWFQPVWNGQATTPWILSAIVAKKAAEDRSDADAQKFMDACYTTTDYFLGNNPLGYVWMTNVGHEHPKNILHKDSEYDNVPEFVPGIPPYSPRTIGDWWMGADYNNVHDNDFCLTDGRLYPAYYDASTKLQWPVHELYFDNYTSPPGTEFTVHQNCAPAAAAYGFVTADGETSTPNAYPEVTLTPNKTSYTQGETVEITLTLNDDEWIYKTDLFQNNRMITTLGRGINTFEWTAPEAGDYYLTATAQDNRGLKTTTDSVKITVTAATDMPGINILSPTDGGYLLQNEVVTVEVETSGTIDKVVYYNYSEKLTEKSESPYAYDFTPTELGTYKLRAVAINETSGLTAEDAATVTAVDAIVLSSLGVSTGTLSPAFDQDVNAYTATLSKTVDEMPTLTPVTDMDASIRIVQAKGWDQRIYPDAEDRTDTVWMILNDKSDSVFYTVTYLVDTGDEGVAEKAILFEDFGSAASGKMLANQYTDYSSADVADFIADSVSINNWWQVSPTEQGASGGNKLWLGQCKEDPTDEKPIGDTLHFTNIDISGYSEISSISFWAFANTGWGDYASKAPSCEISVDGGEYQKLFIQNEQQNIERFDCQNKFGFVEIPVDVPLSGSTMTFRIGTFDEQQWMIDDLSLTSVSSGCYTTLKYLIPNAGELDSPYDPDDIKYYVELPYGTTTVPSIDAEATEESAQVNITPAQQVNQELYPNRNDRTTVIEVENCDKSTTYKVEFSVGEVGIQEHDLAEMVKIYPNPGTDVLMLSNVQDFDKLVISDLLGRVVLTKQLNGTAIYQMSVSDLSNGTYLIQLQKDNSLSQPIQYVKY